ncbi:hypothetical protein [Nodosilinea nodulosa]|uniref:hypothetical protein n=1 Tax=Nodosilinea nodulosa TaxID=416001 RepID=UPI0002F937F4|nr:hypothetical protein [Nodosilinea nodulosa]
MPRPSLSLFGALIIGVGTSLVPLAAHAHKTEVSGDVAGTWHLEPDHSAKAGEPAQVWVALTQQGGRVIPLDQCNCNLAVYRANQTDGPPIMQPVLKAMSPESFENIPGAEITFPEVGEYRIVLTGSPKATETFSPFELSYTTVVAAGRPEPTPATPQPESSTPAADQSAPAQAPPASQGEEPAAPMPQAWRLWVAAGGIAVAIAAALTLRQPKPPASD